MKAYELYRAGVLVLRAAGIAEAEREAELLLGGVAHVGRVELYAHEVEVGEEGVRAFEGAIARRARREPMQYILGRVEFAGYEIEVGPGVLVPRPETEFVVMEAVRRLGGELVIAEPCVGSGAIAVALAGRLPGAVVHATDISVEALAYAGRNVERNGLGERVKLYKGSMMGPLGGLGGLFDAVVSNPPYVRRGDMEGLELEVRCYEPERALVGGEDGLDCYRELLPEAAALTRTGGLLVLEMGAGQGAELSAMASEAGYERVEVLKDLAGHDRILVAERAGARHAAGCTACQRRVY